MSFSDPADAQPPSGSSTTPRIWLGAAVFVSVVLVVGTVLGRLDMGEGVAYAILSRLYLGFESNAAAWGSGMLLALVGVHAYDGYATHRGHDRRAGQGWLLICFVMFVLSADEVGSVHERVGNFAVEIGVSPALLLAPFGAVLVGALARAFWVFLTTASERGKVLPLLIGFAFFGSVAVQEVIEHRLDLTSPWSQALRVGIEEGSELAGMLILLWVTMKNTRGLWGRAGDREPPLFELAADLRWPVAIGSIIGVAALAVFAEPARPKATGHPADWLAAVLFLGSALGIVRRAFLLGRGSPALWSLAALSLVGSVIVVDFSADRLVDFYGVTLSLRVLLLLVVSALVVLGATGATRPGGPDRPSLVRAALAMAALALAALFLPVGLERIYLVSQGLALVTYLAVNATPTTPPGSSTPTPVAPGG